MYHSDLVGGLAARVAGVRSVVWGIRHTTLEPGKSKKATILVARVCAMLSWKLPVRIVVCAQRAMAVHEDLGYDRTRMRLISNGYDLSKFYPRPDSKREFRRNHCIDYSTPLIGMVARFDAQKDHVNLLNALEMLRDQGLRFYCVLVGSLIEPTNRKLVDWITSRELNDYVHLLGRVEDVPSVMNALDLHVLSSSSEGFPNVVAEAMACGTPCVVTDVGDAGHIVGGTGWVVPPGDALALSEAIAAAIDELDRPGDADSRRRIVRRRIEEYFSIESMLMGYLSVWNESIAS